MVEWLPWLKALHVVAAIAWMAGILYLFRLFVYHAAETEPVVKERLVVWERKLMRAIANPAMGATWLFGGWMLYLRPDLWSQPWMHAKLGLVVALTAVHHLAYPLRSRLAEGRPVLPERALRVLNEVPTLLMIGIVIMVIVRPWSR